MPTHLPSLGNRQGLVNLLAPFEGIASGRCFVMGTGPSLLGISRKLKRLLKKEVTIGAGTFIDVPGWFTPTYTMCREYNAGMKVEEAAIGIQKLNMPRWLLCPFLSDPGIVGREPTSEFFWKVRKWHWVFADPNLHIEDWVPEKPLWRLPMLGHNAALQTVPMLWWMGFTEIYLLGCENTPVGYAYNQEQKRPWADTATVQQMALSLVEKLEPLGTVLKDCTEDGLLTIPKARLIEVLTAA